MSGRAPSVANIPPGVSFVDALARGLLARWDGDPLKLSRATVLLPTRRACRTLAEAFLRASEGRPLLLPRLVPLGDIDAEELILSGEDGLAGESLGSDLPPAMPALRRLLLLSRLILAWANAEKGAVGIQAPSEDQAARLAAELGRLLDQVETEGLDFGGLAGLVPETYAAHWQTTLKFLSILTEQWPAVQAEEGCIGPAERRRLLLEAQAEAWRRNPPADPVIVAGSTGSIPAAAALIAVVARLPQGQVVLPGLDRGADDETWAGIRREAGHPQHGLAILLEHLGVAREAVVDWPGTDLPPTAVARADFVNRALRPAEQTSEWRIGADGPAQRELEAALAGVRRIDCAGPGEEATVIALLLRQALTLPGRRAALVTPDRGLARRVASELRRWDIEVDDSAGTPLGETPPGTFLRLTAEMVAARLAPLPLLAALKHPLAAAGLSEGAFRARARLLERLVLRGPRPAAGFAGLLEGLQAQGPDRAMIDWVESLAELAAPLVQALERSDAGLAGVVDAHVAFAEGLAANDQVSGADRLWAQEAGEAAAGFVTELREAAAGAPAFSGERYPALLAGLMAGQVVRPRYGAHPRLAILGPLEARLQHADLVVLGGLNEDTWPAEVDTGPWLSRPMRADFGLPAPERRIGLAAHDFAQAFSAPEVYLTRATRVEGTPSVPSRWLLRIDALLAALDLPAIHEEARWLDWAAALDAPAEIRPGAPPEPRPPVAARPRRLSVTRIETWMRDPYALYARAVLGLEPLDPIDADPGAADRGILVHTALERFIKAHPRALPEDPAAALLAEGARVFEEIRARPGVWAFWWPRFQRIAHWFAEQERLRRGNTAQAWSEVSGRLELAGPAGAFELTAKADRIDLGSDGGLAILDYKTGAVPAQPEIELGFAPQLPLEAAIAAAGGFGPGVPAGVPASLEHWRLTGGQPPGEIKVVKGKPGELAEQALAGLSRLIALFDRPETPYPAMPWPGREPRYNAYAHLARVKEWSPGAPREAGA